MKWGTGPKLFIFLEGLTPINDLREKRKSNKPAISSENDILMYHLWQSAKTVPLKSVTCDTAYFCGVEGGLGVCEWVRTLGYRHSLLPYLAPFLFRFFYLNQARNWASEIFNIQIFYVLFFAQNRFSVLWLT